MKTTFFTTYRLAEWTIAAVLIAYVIITFDVPVMSLKFACFVALLMGSDILVALRARQDCLHDFRSSLAANLTDMEEPTMLLSLEVRRELQRARQLHGPMANPHEALAVIEEEVYEFKLEVYKKQSLRDKQKMRSELVQSAAMCMRAVLDCDL